MNMKALLFVLVSVSVAVGTVADDFDIDNVRRCGKLFVQDYCNADDEDGIRDFVTDSLNSAVRCNRSDFADIAAASCARDSETGTYCGEAEYYVRDLVELLSVCAAPIANVSADCPPECTTRLQNMRDGLGCCINAVYNKTGGTYFDNRPFSDSLWSRCGVEPVTSTCTGVLTYEIDEVDSTCSFLEFNNRNARIYCESAEVEEYRQAVLLGEDCEDFEQLSKDYCNQHPNGNYCFSIDVSEDFPKYINAILEHCQNSNQSCSPECKQSLSDFRNDRHCCVNTVYNSTLAKVLATDEITSLFLADDSLFKLCDVDAPPLTCGTSGSLPLESFTFTLLLPFVMSLLQY